VQGVDRHRVSLRSLGPGGYNLVDIASASSTPITHRTPPRLLVEKGKEFRVCTPHENLDFGRLDLVNVDDRESRNSTLERPTTTQATKISWARPVNPSSGQPEYSRQSPCSILILFFFEVFIFPLYRHYPLLHSLGPTRTPPLPPTCWAKSSTWDYGKSWTARGSILNSPPCVSTVNKHLSARPQADLFLLMFYSKIRSNPAVNSYLKLACEVFSYSLLSYRKRRFQTREIRFPRWCWLIRCRSFPEGYLLSPAAVSEPCVDDTGDSLWRKIVGRLWVLLQLRRSFSLQGIRAGVGTPTGTWRWSLRWKQSGLEREIERPSKLGQYIFRMRTAIDTFRAGAFTAITTLHVPRIGAAEDWPLPHFSVKLCAGGWVSMSVHCGLATYRGCLKLPSVPGSVPLWITRNTKVSIQFNRNVNAINCPFPSFQPIKEFCFETWLVNNQYDSQFLRRRVIAIQPAGGFHLGDVLSWWDAKLKDLENKKVERWSAVPQPLIIWYGRWKCEISRETFLRCGGLEVTVWHRASELGHW